MRLSSAFLALIAAAATAQQQPPPAAPKSTDLPVTHVSLYKNGVGFFEHTGHVTGNAAVTIDFSSAQLNDVLQSLTAIDLNGGHITGAGYNSTTPLDQQLRNLPLSLNDNPTVQSFYSSLRGSRIEVHSGTIDFTGRLLSVETGGAIGASATNQGSQASDSPEHLLLTLVADTGDVRTIVVTANTSVHLADPALHLDVTHYLQLLDSTRSQGLRHLTIEDRGTGQRELRVSYISEVPIWKSTYRILLSTPKNASAAPTATVQGWSVVDNTTGTDWNNVQLSLIAGAPQSFIQPLSQPIYSRRPEIPIAQEAQLSPQTFSSAFTGGRGGSGLAGSVTDQSGAVVPNATVTAINNATGQRATTTSDGQGRFSFALQAGSYNLQASSPGFQKLIEDNVTVDGQQYASVNMPLHVGSASQTVEVTAGAPMMETSSASVALMGGSIANRYKSPRAAMMAASAPPPPPMSYEDAAAGSFASTAQNNSFDDFFAYNISEPITIHKNESALVPTLQAKVAAEGVTLVHSDGMALSTPLRALWLTNNTGTTLDRGSFSVIEDGQFGGEGLLDPIHPGEKRLLSYAADQAIRVSIENGSGTDRIVRISAAKGVLTIQRAEHQVTTYVIHNAASEPRTVVLEHPVRGGYVLEADVKPEEAAPDLYRFRVAVPAAETVRLPVAANHEGFTTFQLTNSDESQLAMIVLQANNSPSLVASLQPILEARRKVAAADEAVDQAQTKLNNLHADEDRQRANITALATADKSAKDRFVHDLNSTEDAIKATQAELDARTAAQNDAEAELAHRIESLQLDDKL